VHACGVHVDIDRFALLVVFGDRSRLGGEGHAGRLGGAQRLRWVKWGKKIREESEEEGVERRERARG
jgi:hypothetical protein